MISIEQSIVKPEVWFLKFHKEGYYVDLTLQLTEDDVIDLFRACAKTEIGRDMLNNFKNR